MGVTVTGINCNPLGRGYSLRSTISSVKSVMLDKGGIALLMRS